MTIMLSDNEYHNIAIRLAVETGVQISEQEMYWVRESIHIADPHKYNSNPIDARDKYSMELWWSLCEENFVLRYLQSKNVRREIIDSKKNVYREQQQRLYTILQPRV